MTPKVVFITLLAVVFAAMIYHVISALAVAIISNKDPRAAQWIADAPSRLVSALATWLWPFLFLALFRIRIERVSDRSDDDA